MLLRNDIEKADFIHFLPADFTYARCLGWRKEK